MQFSKTAPVPQLYLASDNGNATPGTLLYLLPQNASNLPATISFSDSWSKYTGTYIFLEQPLAEGSESAFATAAWNFLADPRQQGVRFAWFDTPDGSGLLSGTTIAVYQPSPGAAYLTGYSVSFAFQNVTLFMAARTPVVPDNTNFAFNFTQPGSQAIYLLAEWGKVAINGIGPTVTLPFTGNLAGCLQFALQLTQENLSDLDVGLRYFYAVPPNLNAQETTQDGSFTLASLRYPLFNQGLTLYANLDPLAALTAARTFFAFSAADAGQSSGSAAPAVAAYFNATLGDAFNLQPLTGSAAPTAFAALVFAVNRQASAPTAHDPFYLVPRGDFALQTTRSGTVDLMCGLSGVEYFGLDAAKNIVSFFPGNAAFATGFFPGEKPGYTNLQPSVAPTTAFAAVSTASSVVEYFAQPDQSVLYNFGSQTVSGVTTVPALAAVPVQAAALNWPPVSSLVFPLLPYSGLGGPDLAAYQQMESQIISPVRRAALLNAPPAGQGPTLPSKYSATPQGLLVAYTSPLEWDQIILAQMALPADSPAQFMLTSVQGNLLSAFQSNKLFLVISDPTKIQSSLLAQNAQITIGADPAETWNFNLDPAQWAEFGTILIVKFYDISISDLAGQTDTWAFGDYFNTSPSGTSTTIENIIAGANPNDPDFAAFLNAVNNPNWNGVLMLNAQSPLQELPAELAGLAAGIDPSAFFAHHIGINASQIIVPNPPPGNLGIANSSIFGLINYNAPTPLKPGDGDYQFQVEQLKVLFLNSAVANFSSTIELQINVLFGEAAKLEGSNDNIVRMYGSYQKQVVNGQTLESYLFQTQSGQTSIFDMKSNVLNAVQLNKGQFVTVTSQSTATSTLSQFIFWGLLDFKSLPKFDLFSFGREDNSNTPAGLSFGNLVIEMTDDPQDVPAVPQFTFDASQLSFDLAGSTARQNSFFNHFPLTVAGFTQATTGTAPTDLGYMGVQSPLSQSSLVYPWYSLNFNLNLGTPGALAAEVGFVAGLTAAWSPSLGTNYTVFTGLKLPGSSGSKREITIEGIFNITFKTLEIIALAESNTYILVLYNIAFKFFKFTFPPVGQVNFVLFGDPNASATSNTSLGWYAAYAKPETKKSGGTSKSGLTARPSQTRLLAPSSAIAVVDDDD